MIRFLRTSALALACACACAAPGASDGSDAGTLPGTDCGSACQAKAIACGAPPAMGASACATLCARGANSGQLACLESTPCSALIASFTAGDPICGIGAVETVDAGGVARTDAGGAATDAGPVGSCRVGDRRCLDDFTAFRCETLAGRAVEVTESCTRSVGPCEEGYCVNIRNPGTGSTCTTASDCRAPALCEASVCCIPEAEICTRDSDCCEGACSESEFDFRVCRR